MQIIAERHTNERVGYLINRKKMSTSLENLSEIDQTNNIKIKRHQTERLKENFYKLRVSFLVVCFVCIFVD